MPPFSQDCRRIAAKAAAALIVLSGAVSGAPSRALAGAHLPAIAVGPSVQLASPPFTAFTGGSLVLADFDGANGPDLAGLNGSNVVIAARQPGGTFAAQQSFAMGPTVETLRSADLDGDGRLDLVATAYSARSIVSRLNLGGMTFGAPATVPTGGNARGLAVGDLNGDGRPDAVTALYDSAEIAVSLNDGAGNLQAPFRLPVAAGTGLVEIGEFTGDGAKDVVAVTSPGPSGCTVSVFPGHGDGTFDAARNTTFPIDGRLSMDQADLDGDGDLDLVLFLARGIYWCANLGDGTFATPVSVGLPFMSYDVYGETHRFAIGDVDRDGHPDIVAALRSARTWDDWNIVAVLINRGDGTFFPPANHHLGRHPDDAALADLDDDGWLDIVATTSSTFECCQGATIGINHAYTFRNSGFGTFDAHLEISYPVWMPLRRADGPADLVGTSGGRLTRALNRGHGTFLASEDFGRGAPWRAVDLDGDGNDELIVTSSDSLWVLLGLGSGAYGPPSSVHTGLALRDVADVNSDGRLDLLVHDASLHAQILPGDGAGSLGAAVDYAFTLPESPSEEAMRGIDANGDGRADLLFLPRNPQVVTSGSINTYAGWLHVALNDGAGHFAPADSFQIQWTATGANTLSHLASGDFDGDHIPDVQMLVASCGNDVGRNWGTWRGLGGGAFAALGNGTSAGSSPCDVAAADLNGDGLTDLVRVNGTGGWTMSAKIYTATGGGSFAESSSGDMGNYPSEVFLADMDGDAVPDVVTRSAYFNTGSIRRNVTSFSPPTPALLALVSASVEDGAAWLNWFGADATIGSVALERGTEADGWSALATIASDGTGHLRYVDHALPAAARVGYRLRWSDADGEHFTAETWLDLPRTEFALHGAWPNPSRAFPTIALVLPRAGSVDIDLFDVSGRRLSHERRAGLAAGPQRIEVATRPLEPGVYLARVAYAGQRLETRFVVLR